MKKFLIVLLITVLMVVLATQAFAGVFGAIKGFVTSSAIHGAITAFFAILAVIFGASILNFKNPVIMMYEAYCEYRDAKLKDSQGGEKVTREEWDKIFTKIGNAVMALLAVCPARWAKKFNTG